MSHGRKLRYTVRVSCEVNGAEGTYEIKARSQYDAKLKAIGAFQESCEMAAAYFIPRPDDCEARVVGARA